MREILSTLFIGNLKLGDNIRFNVLCVDSLYEQLDKAAPHTLKPIVLINTSITEALMIDFVRRVKNHTKEFTYLTDAIRVSVRKLPSDKRSFNFEKCIKEFRKNKLLGESDNFYDCVDFLRKIRNKIHIQNTFHRTNESEVWMPEILAISEAVTEYSLRFLAKNYPRPLESDFVGGIQLAWTPHYDSKTKLCWKKMDTPS